MTNCPKCGEVEGSNNYVLSVAGCDYCGATVAPRLRFTAHDFSESIGAGHVPSFDALDVTSDDFPYRTEATLFIYASGEPFELWVREYGEESVKFQINAKNVAQAKKAARKIIRTFAREES